MKLATWTTITLLFITLIMAVSCQEEHDCERERKKSLESKIDMKIIFECESDGSYKALQCFQKSKFCVCYSSDGYPISPMSSKLRACECIREAEIAKSKGIGAYIPSCAEDGYYDKKQCHGSTGLCWCVDKLGQKTSAETRDPISC